MIQRRIFLLFTAFFLLAAPCSFADGTNPYVLPLKIMSYNIRHGAGIDDVFDLDRTAGVINKQAPDVVGLQEVDSAGNRSKKIDETAYLAKATGMYGTFGPAIPLGNGKYGVAILSKEKPISTKNIPLPGAEKRTLLVCEFEHYVFACTHLDLSEDRRLESIPIIIEEAAKWEKPFYICGDWNDTPGSKTITQIKRSFTILSRTTNVGSTSCYTFPADKPTSCIDYIAKYKKGTTKAPKTREVIDEPAASDHRPILVKIELNITPQGIGTPLADDAPRPVYSLDGRPAGQHKQKGIYIIGKKKLFVK